MEPYPSVQCKPLVALFTTVRRISEPTIAQKRSRVMRVRLLVPGGVFLIVAGEETRSA